LKSETVIRHCPASGYHFSVSAKKRRLQNICAPISKPVYRPMFSYLPHKGKVLLNQNSVMVWKEKYFPKCKCCVFGIMSTIFCIFFRNLNFFRNSIFCLFVAVNDNTVEFGNAFSSECFLGEYFNGHISKDSNIFQF
jgi:hypothetical protein